MKNMIKKNVNRQKQANSHLTSSENIEKTRAKRKLQLEKSTPVKESRN